MARSTGAMTAVIASAAADIVSQVTVLIPPPTAFVPDLLTAQLPRVIPESQTNKIPAADHLVNLATTGALPDILKGPIPHKTWIAKLRNELDSARASGRTVSAIRHPVQRDLIVPLWAIPVWDLIAGALQDCMLWNQTMDWLRPNDHKEEDRELVEHACTLIKTLPWGMKAWALYGSDRASRVAFLARFLSSCWLGERNIDIMGVCCNAREGGAAGHYMALASLGVQLGWIASRDELKIQNNSDLSVWKSLAADKGIRTIHIPVNLANTHWVVFCVDLKLQTYWWGMPLPPTCVHVTR